jgi:hypothetical protein
MTGRLAQAEDRLHELLESAPGSIEFGRGFYDRLLARPDRELEAGGLNREEAVQGRAELERHGHV